jgi:ABC-type branched-subunit amino acid transport system permease subunit
MDEHPIDPNETDVPVRPDEAQRPRIGVDEWVARHEDRSERYAGPWGRVRRLIDRTPPAAQLGVALVIGCLFPLVATSDYVTRVGVDTMIYILLALGLNVVLGYAGLLDLGYIAFFGFGAYTYALLSSNQLNQPDGIHLPSGVAMLVVLVLSAILGFLLGLPSGRLFGDYLAIVTLFFGLMFVEFTNNANRIGFPFGIGQIDLTGGPNGITNIDPISFFGFELTAGHYDKYFYFLLVMFAIYVVLIYFANESRTGRAWRALREEPLAAEMMSIPVKRLKLLAFVFGAATAGLTGSVFASLQANVFPSNFGLPILITLYAMVILGGVGSIPGVIVGAIVLNSLLEILTVPSHARDLFYGAIVVAMLALIRPWRLLAAVAAGTIAFGFVVHAIGDAFWERGTAGTPQGGSRLADALDSWVLVPSNPKDIGNVAFVVLVAAVLALTVIKPPWRWILLPPVLYLAAFVWENRLIYEPSVTRFILIGAALVALMAARPQGLLGTPRVEIV